MNPVRRRISNPLLPRSQTECGENCACTGSVGTCRDDPLYSDTSTDEDDDFTIFSVDNLDIYPGFYGLEMISETIYTQMTYRDNRMCGVPLSAFNYYCAVLSYARMLHLLKSSEKISPEEEDFVESVYSMNFQLPASLAMYLRGLGNIVVNDAKVWVRAGKRQYVTSAADGSSGWFGRVDNSTRPLYTAYPCLAVYIQCMKQDLLFNNSENPEWNLPADIRPEEVEGNIGFSMSSVFGYAPATLLTPNQRSFLENGQAGFLESHAPIPLLHRLMEQVQSRITLSRILTCDLPIIFAGSHAQIVAIKKKDDARMVGQHMGIKISNGITKAARACLYWLFADDDKFNTSNNTSDHFKVPFRGLAYFDRPQEVRAFVRRYMPYGHWR